MKFIEIVETVESIETKLSALSEAKLALLETILEEGAETQFDVEYHIDYLVEFIESQSDENATTIAESVNGGQVLDIILEAARKHTNDKESFIVEAVEKVGNIDITLIEEGNTASVTLLSVVTNTLTEMLGESVVEGMPAEMVFDIVESAKELELVEGAETLTLVELVEEISTKLERAIKSGAIDVDSDDYVGETLSEFLNDYTDTEDLLEEMAQVNEDILSESIDIQGANLMRKAKAATTLIEAKMEACPKGDMKCKQDKAKKAKAYYAKHEFPGGGKPEDWAMDKITGKLAKHVKAAAKASKEATGKPLSKEYIQYVLVPGIIKRMRIKNKKMTAKSKLKKQGMR